MLDGRHGQVEDCPLAINHIREEAGVTLAVQRIAETDAAQFGHQYPAYAADIAGETRKALDALRTDPLHRERYDRFLADMVYGERFDFRQAMETVDELASRFTQP